MENTKIYIQSIYPNSYFPNAYIDSVMASQNGGGSILPPGGTPPPPPSSTCNNIIITGTFTANAPGGWCDTIIPGGNGGYTWSYNPGMQDPYGNDIYFTGSYGSDPRQKYYVYYPQEKLPTSPIVILIHGGGWFTGPKPSTVNGFELKFALGNDNNSMVKDLLNNGYVVVSLLYRLVNYANLTESVLDNPVSMQMQIDDINAAVSHIKSNFPICLDLNANSVQVLGESAGGHLALLWAYTQANTSYTKSIISMYAPTDMNLYANNLKNKYCWNTTTLCNYTCGNNFLCTSACGVSGTLKHIPYYFMHNINNQFKSFGSVSDLTCGVSSSDLLVFNNICNSSGNNPQNQANFCNSDFRVIVTYRLLESALRKNIPTNTASTDIDLQNMSPYFRLSSNRIVPTFIMHGTSDNIVPSQWLGSSMQTTLSNSNLGGLISNSVYANTSIPASGQYSSYTEKHLMKTYTNAGHGWDNASFTQVRADVITWLNGHK